MTDRACSRGEVVVVGCWNFGLILSVVSKVGQFLSRLLLYCCHGNCIWLPWKLRREKKRERERDLNVSFWRRMNECGFVGSCCGKGRVGRQESIIMKGKSQWSSLLLSRKYSSPWKHLLL